MSSAAMAFGSKLVKITPKDFWKSHSMSLIFSRSDHGYGTWGIFNFRTCFVFCKLQWIFQSPKKLLSASYSLLSNHSPLLSYKKLAFLLLSWTYISVSWTNLYFNVICLLLSESLLNINNKIYKIYVFLFFRLKTNFLLIFIDIGNHAFRFLLNWTFFEGFYKLYALQAWEKLSNQLKFPWYSFYFLPWYWMHFVVARLATPLVDASCHETRVRFSLQSVKLLATQSFTIGSLDS